MAWTSSIAWGSDSAFLSADGLHLVWRDLAPLLGARSTALSWVTCHIEP